MYADMRGGSPGWGRQKTVGLSTTAMFGDFGGYFFGNVTDKTSNVTWRYATPVIDCKMNDLE